MRGRRWSDTIAPKNPIAALFIVQKGLCCLCGGPMSYQYTSREHIVPRSKGGAPGLHNVLLSHPTCNRDRKDADATPALLDLLYAAHIARGTQVPRPPRLYRWLLTPKARRQMRPNYTLLKSKPG